MNAVILAMPGKTLRKAKQRMNRVELAARHSWVMEHRSEWENVATDGVRYETDPMQIRLKKMIRETMGWPDLTMDRMRRDIAKGRKLIEKRNAVKAWLASMGADLDNIKDAEQALFFAFDHAQARAGT